MPPRPRTCPSPVQAARPQACPLPTPLPHPGVALVLWEVEEREEWAPFPRQAEPLSCSNVHPTAPRHHQPPPHQKDWPQLPGEADGATWSPPSLRGPGQGRAGQSWEPEHGSALCLVSHPGWEQCGLRPLALEPRALGEPLPAPLSQHRPQRNEQE